MYLLALNKSNSQLHTIPGERFPNKIKSCKKIKKIRVNLIVVSSSSEINNETYILYIHIYTAVPLNNKKKLSDLIK